LSETGSILEKGGGKKEKGKKEARRVARGE